MCREAFRINNAVPISVRTSQLKVSSGNQTRTLNAIPTPNTNSPRRIDIFEIASLVESSRMSHRHEAALVRPVRKLLKSKISSLHSGFCIIGSNAEIVRHKSFPDIEPRWGSCVTGARFPRVRCATLGFDVKPRWGWWGSLGFGTSFSGLRSSPTT